MADQTVLEATHARGWEFGKQHDGARAGLTCTKDQSQLAAAVARRAGPGNLAGPGSGPPAPPESPGPALRKTTSLLPVVAGGYPDMA